MTDAAAGTAPAQDARDRAFMRRALRLARKGWGRTAPNPMVGAVVVRDDQVVGEGWHREFGLPHAEPEALRAAGERARGATVYVSLEPCDHHGRTPPCTEALIAAGVRRVVYAASDPNPVARGGAERLRRAGIEVVGGVEADAARELNAPFMHAAGGADRPWVSLKLALSLDGALADHTGRPGWLTGAQARLEVHRMRANADAVGVGLGTAVADDPELTVRGVPAPRVAPLRVVFDRAARLPLDRKLVRTAREVPTVVVASAPADDRRRLLEQAGVEVLVAPGLPAQLRLLRERGVRHLFVEGGAGIAGSLLEAGLVDRLIIFQAPVLLGAGALGAFSAAPSWALDAAPRPELVERKAFGPDLMSVFAFPSSR